MFGNRVPSGLKVLCPSSFWRVSSDGKLREVHEIGEANEFIEMTNVRLHGLKGVTLYFIPLRTLKDMLAME